MGVVVWLCRETLAGLDGRPVIAEDTMLYLRLTQSHKVYLPHEANKEVAFVEHCVVVD